VSILSLLCKSPLTVRAIGPECANAGGQNKSKEASLNLPLLKTLYISEKRKNNINSAYE